MKIKRLINMKITVSTIVSVSGNSTSKGIVNDYLNNHFGTLTNENLVKYLTTHLIQSGEQLGDVILPLDFKEVNGVSLTTSKVKEDFYGNQDKKIGSIDYTYEFEVISKEYECINTFPNREFLLVELGTDNLINYVAPKGFAVNWSDKPVD
jgi:DNA/RNA endonuclease YhcR with UshA esterase domain